MEESPQRYLPVAEKYDIAEMKAACSASMIKLLSKENVVQSLIMADLNRCPNLKKTCFKKFKIWKASMSDKALDPLKAHPELLLEYVKMS